MELHLFASTDRNLMKRVRTSCCGRWHAICVLIGCSIIIVWGKSLLRKAIQMNPLADLGQKLPNLSSSFRYFPSLSLSFSLSFSHFSFRRITTPQLVIFIKISFKSCNKTNNIIICYLTPLLNYCNKRQHETTKLRKFCCQIFDVNYHKI